ncbi:activating signal cointegrator 1 complex subunit 1-like [Oppia nitens]|uniref:activating signal cointegrator 1 complex subunit 1-like n=1 Tax=Oppia nitens TaxID=1686743 RepID=UPI0023DBB903|nr:activating signal cointegrator 1 complex subunit 1-like [Oppia nitens]
MDQEISDNNISEDQTSDQLAEEEVTTYKDNNNMTLFRWQSLVSNSMITKKVKNSLNDWKRNIKTNVKFEIKSNDKCLVTITDQNKDKVVVTKEKFNQLIINSRRLRPFTHLITVPFISDSLKDEFNQFKDNILTNFVSDGNRIDEYLFQKTFKLHLTVCVLVLLNDNEILLAKKLLRDSLDQIINPVLNGKPLKVTLEGLQVIKGQQERAHVVYAEVKEETNTLQTIADQIVNKFIKAGLLGDCGDNTVKLHVTFINSLFRQRALIKQNTENKKRIKRETFNAKEILDFYKSYKFSEYIVKCIQLNEIKSITSEGFYGFVDGIDLPQD